MSNNDTAKEILIKTTKKIEGAYSPNTIRAYKSNFESFIQYCDEISQNAYPAEHQTIIGYIKNISDGRLKSSSIKIAVASISAIHRFNSEIDHTQHSDVKIEMRRVYRTLGRFTKQAYGIPRTLLKRMIDATDDSLRGCRNRAILLLAYDTLCRRGEIANLSMEDLAIIKSNKERKIQLTLRKSKTDPEGYGRPLYLSKDAELAIFEWIKKSNIRSGKLFRAIYGKNNIKKSLNLGQINRIYKRLAKKIGENINVIRSISGHSMRVGAAQDLLLNGKELTTIMNRGRWSKTDTVMRYIEMTTLI
jgi:site-specific recombinase XerD